MQPVDLHEFVKNLKLNKTITQRQCVVIDNLFIYFSDLKVYKIVVQINPSVIKKSRKLGFTNPYTTIFVDDIPIKIDKHLNCDVGKFIAIYNPNTADCSIYHGEESESEQLKHHIS